MATLYDVVTLLSEMGFYSVIFPFILIFALVYGILSYIKPFGPEAKTVNVIIAVVIGLIYISFTKAVTFIVNLIPMLTALFVVLLLILLVFMFMGVPSTTIGETLKNPAAYGTILAIVIIFIFIAIAAAFPETAYITQPEKAPPGVEPGIDMFGEAIKTIFHPTIVGLIVLIMIFAAATYMITREKK